MTLTLEERARVATAIHEAGHTVAAVVVGVPISYVSIVRDDWADTSGGCSLDPWAMTTFDRDELDTINAAGAVAQAIAGEIGAYDVDRCLNDIDHVVHRRTVAAGQRAWRAAVRRAGVMLLDNWLGVINTANLLLMTGIVDGTTVIDFALRPPIKSPLLVYGDTVIDVPPLPEATL